MYYHLHEYKFESKLAKSHKHILEGFTGNMIGINPFHFHYFYGVCSFNGHTHNFSGITGMPIRTRNGHVHKMEGILETTNRHSHVFKCYTFEDVSYLPRSLMYEALI